ncbi:MAG: SDR family oxidoreductase [Desulfobacteraceae bacterium]|nr:SDR family oxidoreductase [Desulfobacteraceae bacterium]MBC2757318.1 SDR family oxidoreductase [Desulfobacteraceae bacterium]
MERNIFITGYPGFVGSKVVDLFLEENNPLTKDDNILLHALVHEDFYQAAVSKVSQLSKSSQDRITLIKGDLCEDNFGLPETKIQELSEAVNEIIHIAAVYRLDVEETLAYKTNVIGTRNILSFALGIKSLRTLTHISSIIVSGKRKGIIFEDQLAHDAGFHNHYESTKHYSEVLMEGYKDKLPIVILRPAVIAGDSMTGAIGKYDGPYYTIKLYHKMRFFPGFLVPLFGAHSSSYLNVVPVDYIAKSIVYISKQPEAIGRTFHLADKHPLTYHEYFTLVHEKIFGKGRKISMPLWIEKIMKWMPLWMARIMGVSKAGSMYLNHVSFYDTKNTDEILEGSGVTCPSFQSYLDAMVAFVKENPDIPMSI